MLTSKTQYFHSFNTKTENFWPCIQNLNIFKPKTEILTVFYNFLTLKKQNFEEKSTFFVKSSQ